MGMLEQYEGSPEQLARDEVTEEHTERWIEFGQGWSDFVFAVYRAKRQGIVIKRLSIRLGIHDGSDSLITLVADGPDGPVVAFHGAEGAGRMWVRLAKRMFEDKLQWKEDQYAK